MNPYSPEQRIACKIVENALNRCQMKKENTEFLIQVKETLIGISRQGIESLNDEFFMLHLF